VETREDCEVRRMGRYQYCKACSMWAMCHPGGILLRPCPPGMLWDDEFKVCRMQSSTCNRRDVIIPENAVAKADEDEERQAKTDAFQQFQDAVSSKSNLSPDSLSQIENTDSCVSRSCEGREVGRYAFCRSCRLYVHCSAKGRMIIMGCPPGLKWDDTHKRCKVLSSTCSLLDGPDDSSEEDQAEPAEGPAESVEDPMESVENPAESVEDPTESVEDPTESVEDPMDSVEDPTESVEDPAESVEDQTESVEDPAKSMEDPKESVEDNQESTESNEMETNDVFKDRPKFQDLYDALREKAHES